MKPRTLLFGSLFVGLLLASRPARADRLWTLQLHGGGVVLSLDPPEERGNLLVFHRAPEGALSSLRADTVRRITIASGPAKKSRRSLDGQVLILGHDLDADEREEVARSERSPALPPPETPYDDFGYVSAYGGGGGGGGSGYRPGRGPGVRQSEGVRPLARPNGFPIVPGAVGSDPLRVGPNGFPILDQQPVTGGRLGGPGPGPSRGYRSGHARRFPG
ncbi:MAG: hypothetical protein ABI682_13840 [Acidobacteriota bacterium]